MSRAEGHLRTQLWEILVVLVLGRPVVVARWRALGDAPWRAARSTQSITLQPTAGGLPPNASTNGCRYRISTTKYFLWDEPRVYYMHVHAHGKPADLARKLKPALDLWLHAAVAGDGIRQGRYLGRRA